mmetsp:Transcript_36216/g.104250  ORF Transcript_36216/g.104250 Transcript_36216/m.104250 type:complete len:467 (-) Transcript_36216:506-1906(-)
MTNPPADEGLPVFRLRDFPMEPERGMQREMTWLQFQGTVQLRLLLHGSTWEGVTAEEFEVRVSPEELSVHCRSRNNGNQSHLLESINGKLRKAIDPQNCWFALEKDIVDPFGTNRILVVELAKKTPKSWTDGQIFNDELFHRRPFHWSSSSKPGEEPPGWTKLKPGRPLDVEDPYVASRGFLCSEFEVGQTPELVQFNIILDQKKLDDALERVPLNKLFAADCTEKSLKLFIRGDESSPILLGTLGGKVVPDQMSLKVNYVTREVEGHRIKGTMERLPCLEVELVKAPDSFGEWEETIFQDEEVLNQPQGSLEDFEKTQLRQEREPSPDREDWTPDDFADEQKEKADAAFKEGSYRDAIVYYTRALRYTPLEHKLLSNRSAAYLKIAKFQLALDDATKAEQLEPNFTKIYFRKGQALKGLKRFDDAITAFQNGQDVDPKNPEWEREIHRARETKQALLDRKAAKGK